MIRRLTTLLPGCALVLALSASAAVANDVSHADTGLALHLPDGWSGRGGDIISVTDAEETAWIYFWGNDYQTVDKGIEAVESELGSFLQNVKVKGKPSKVEAGSLDARQLSGTAQIEDFKVVWTVVVIQGKGDRVGFLLGFADKDTWAGHTDDFNALLGSIEAVE